ncbi:glycosyltransferase [Nocardioides stalactiti]|uniref:glycosyltransferase n=1 Tax=Nocardioides stalactiti TaxID=2755356 RepID=UPI001FE57D33|nr:glycosyltransferase [Nocardioides stalactiti]
MRIVTVIAELGVGGAETVATTVASAAAARGDDVLVASTPGHRVRELELAGVAHLPVTMVGRNPVDLVRARARLRALGTPDLVHAHNPKATLLARATFGRRVPILSTLHGVAGPEVAAAARILRWASDRVVVVSPHLKTQLEHHGYPSDRIDVVRNAVPPLPSYPRDRARAELGLAPDRVVGLCLARLVDQKRHDLLLDAWGGVADRSTLLVAGDGPHRGRIEAAVQRAGYGEGVRVLGARTDVPRLVAASDFLVLPSDWEGLPVSVLEALAAGLPVVASRVGGLVDLESAVRLVQPGSVPALRAALAEMVDAPAARTTWAACGRALAAERFGTDRMLAGYEHVYARLTGFPVVRPAGTGAVR